uniref:Uncharacterized protein n=1 Tax=Timema bartmani TaxID=61472 RepID=A0A7R9HY77_9NEOP|nr:unnamed protein product [Timema bartmani]
MSTTPDIIAEGTSGLMEKSFTFALSQLTVAKSPRSLSYIAVLPEIAVKMSGAGHQNPAQLTPHPMPEFRQALSPLCISDDLLRAVMFVDLGRLEPANRPLTWTVDDRKIRENGKPFKKNHPHYTRPRLDHPVISSLVYCENSALDNAATETDAPLDDVFGLKKQRIKMFFVNSGGMDVTSKREKKAEKGSINYFDAYRWITENRRVDKMNKREKSEHGQEKKVKGERFYDTLWRTGDDGKPRCRSECVGENGAMWKDSIDVKKNKSNRWRSVENLDEHLSYRNNCRKLSDKGRHRRSYNNMAEVADCKWDLKEKFKDISKELRMHCNRTRDAGSSVNKGNETLDVKPNFCDGTWIVKSEKIERPPNQDLCGIWCDRGQVDTSTWTFDDRNVETGDSPENDCHEPQENLENHLESIYRPGGGSREMLPSGGYVAYQQVQPVTAPGDSPSRTSNPQLVSIRPPSAKMSDEKPFHSISISKGAGPPLANRGCQTPNKFQPTTPLTGLKPVEDRGGSDLTLEQLVPEKDTNTSIGSGPVVLDTCTVTVHDVVLSEENAATRTFKMQQRAALQTVTSKMATVSSSNRQQGGGNFGRGYGSMIGSNGRNNSHLHHHLSVEELRLMQRRQESNGSSSDDGTRSSGHASMSDGHLSSSPPADRHQHYKSHLNSVPEDERLSASVMQNQCRSGRKSTHNRSRHRATPAKSYYSSGLFIS